MKTIEMYEFVPEEIKLFQNKSGVYALIHNNEVIYVGQSKNLSQRLYTHHSKTALEQTIKKIAKEDGKCNRTKQVAMYDFIDKHRTDIYFVILKETNELDKYEKHYIELFKPKYNYKGVDVPY